MVIVSDTTTITNLLKINQIDILKLVFNKIIIPNAVYNELCELPDHRIFLNNCQWISCAEPTNLILINTLEAELDKGEAESIALAIELKADFLIMDEQKGRIIAEKYGLPIVGLLGILLKAKEKGYIPEIKTILAQLIQTAGFHIHTQLFNYVLQKAGET